MPLEPTDYPPSPSEDGVLFGMKDENGQTLGVLATHEVLDDIDPPALDDYIERFNDWRSTFEDIASDKWDRKDIESSPNGPNIRITKDDI